MKLHLQCLLLILVFNTYKASADLPSPELHFENNIIEDEDTKITCKIRNPTCLKVTLEIKGNVTLTHCEDEPADCFTNEHYTTKICTIEVTKEMDQMEFTCEAHFKTQSQPKKMYLQREPEFTDCPEEQVWKEGEENSFHCIATGYPQPNVTCQKKNQKDGTVYRAGERFTTLRSMAGDYTCTAKTFDTTSKFVKVSLQYKPAVRNIIVNPHLHNEGDPVTITCEADGEPPPSYTWKTPSSDVQFSPDNKTITIQKMASSHLGKYQCTASNTIGSHSLEQELNLAVQPIISNITVKPSMEIPVGSNVTLICDAGGIPPPTLSWIHPKVKVQKSEDQRIINIWNITTNHAGNYSCTAQNKHGTTNRTQQITVSGKGNRADTLEMTIILILATLISTGLMFL
ncbi:limbic system-associated membrane protein-like isoform X2 [Dendropsophus ebraccatus]|uniref:limbic system-associated membrane protein-like isoform X2 n=1 Tax=Dendropsophus ebraccatus TaxID=150705 RepID=UPI00383156FD